MAREPVVLLVEDEFLIAFGAAERLEANGFAVITAGSAADAMRVLDDLNDRLAALFLDVHFKDGTTSLDLARAARGRFPDIAVLYTSGLPESDLSGQFVPGGQFLAKPCDMNAVAALLRAMTATFDQKRAAGRRAERAIPIRGALGTSADLARFALPEGR